VADDSRAFGEDEKKDVRRLPLEEEGRLSPVLSVAGIMELLEKKFVNVRGMSTSASPTRGPAFERKSSSDQSSPPVAHQRIRQPEDNWVKDGLLAVMFRPLVNQGNAVLDRRHCCMSRFR